VLSGFGKTTEQRSFEQRIRTGAGFGSPEINRRVENAAILFVEEWYRARGWHVESVEAEKCGYDLRCRKKAAEEHVEVKGIQGEIPSTIITAGELRQARDNPLFPICIVTSALSKQCKFLRYTGQEFVSRFGFEPLAFLATPRK
jgi:hypothetical protein